MLADIFWFILSFFHIYQNDDWSNDFQAKLEQDQATIDGFRAWTQVYFDIHDAVFYGITDIKQYIIPDPWLSLSYNHLLKKLQFYQELEVLKSLPPFQFDDYPNLEVNAEGMIAEYPAKRQRTLAYMALIENLFLDVCKMEGKLPEDMERDIEYDRELIKQHKEARGIIKKSTDTAKPTLQFTAGDSAKKRAYVLLEGNMGKWLTKKEIMRRARIKKDFYAIIYQLRKDILKQDLKDVLEIQNNESKGEYRLVVLAS